MADVIVPNPDDPRLECLRYSPMGMFSDGTLTMDARFMRSIVYCLNAVIQVRTENGHPVSHETEQLVAFLHSITSDAETDGAKLELRTVRPGEKER